MLNTKCLFFESSKQNLCTTPGKITLPTLHHMKNKWKNQMHFENDLLGVGENF